MSPSLFVSTPELIQLFTTKLYLMTTLQKIISGSVLGLFMLLFTVTACKKDSFVHPSQSNIGETANSKISIDEAKNYFSSLDLGKLNALDETGLIKSALSIKIEPLWNLAILSNAQSGREIVIVPLADTTLSALSWTLAN